MENYEAIPKEQFEFAQLDTEIHDKKLETKARGYFADALIRFKKNKSSVIAAWIIGFLVLFAIVSPILSQYSINNTDTYYVNYPPFNETISSWNIGIFDGAKTLESQSNKQLLALHAIGRETGMDPVIKILGTTQVESIRRGQTVYTDYYRVQVNRYYQLAIVSKTLSYEEYQNIQKFQDETGLQVIYPAVLPVDIYPADANLSSVEMMALRPDVNVWYKCLDTKGTPAQMVNGELKEATSVEQLVPAYSSDASLEGHVPYTSTRIEGDPGTYIYSLEKSNSVQCRLCYYNYYQFLQWAKNGSYHAPNYIMGTNNMGQDLFCAIGVGARFSLIFAILVSAINLTIGAIYGAIQGYYGGAVDLILDRISDILSEVPSIVVVTLFQLHLAKKVGSVPSFLFAFIMTGWIGMAALTRKQFYRFKSQEFVYAAKTLGASDWRLMFKHIFPNALGTIVTSCALVIPGVISSETSLTYLGIINLSSFAGTSIGTLMQQGQAAMTASPHAMFFPAMFFSLLMISFNLFGNGLRDAFNPSTRGVED